MTTPPVHTPPAPAGSAPVAPARPGAAGAPLLHARGVTLTYGSGDAAAHALRGVDLSLEPGQSIAITGPSGSGKTSLLHVLAGILAPTTGSVIWRGTDLATLSDRRRTVLRRSDFGFVFQSGELLPELPAVENVALPLLLAGADRRTCEQTAALWLHQLGLGGMESRRPGEMSGGQAQRVAIARALVGNPGVIFADEPTGALDRHTGWDTMRALTGVAAAQGAALVVVTHDPQVAAWCGSILEMRDGLVVGDSVPGLRVTGSQPAPRQATGPLPAAHGEGAVA